MKDKKYLDFEDAKLFVQSIGLHGQKEWNTWCKQNNTKLLKIPTNPQTYYKGIGWKSLSDWFGTTSYKSKRNIKYLSYEDAKDHILVHFPEIINKQKWADFNKEKLPVNIPKRPDYVYKNKGWINWETFLNSNLSPRSKSKLFLTYADAKKYIKKLKFKNEYEYYEYVKENNICFLPLRPDNAYKKQWRGYLDFLECGSNKESYGERKIRCVLEQYSIKYEREKKWNSCKNINELPFDFYLPDFNICIEYDGELHFRSSELFGGDKTLTRIKKHDNIKTAWCASNNIQLLRISYLDKKKIKEIIEKKLGI